MEKRLKAEAEATKKERLKAVQAIKDEECRVFGHVYSRGHVHKSSCFRCGKCRMLEKSMAERPVAPLPMKDVINALASTKDPKLGTLVSLVNELRKSGSLFDLPL